MERSKTITLITGANKGLGYETARQLIEQGHTVYVGARDVARGQAAADKLGAYFVQLDVTDDASVETAMGVIDEREGHLDVLVNNAVGDRDLRVRSAQIEGLVLDRYRLLMHDAAESAWLSSGLRDRLVTWLEPRITWMLER